MSCCQSCRAEQPPDLLILFVVDAEGIPVGEQGAVGQEVGIFDQLDTGLLGKTFAEQESPGCRA